MKQFVCTLALLSLIACAEVPYTENGAIKLHPVANFSKSAVEGPLDQALDELLVKIEPGGEEWRAVAASVAAVIMICQLQDCSKLKTSGGVVLPVGLSYTKDQLSARFAGYRRTQDQVREFADLSMAFVVMAERDVLALADASNTRRAASWEKVYVERLQKLERGERAALKARERLSKFRGVVQRQSAGRAVLPSVVDLEKTSNEQIRRIVEARKQLQASVAKMKSLIGT